MSNIAGKSYAMNVITPLRWNFAWFNKLVFWAALKFPVTLKGLMTLSLIHYARWVIIGRNSFPHLHPDQPKEDLHYSYMLFFSNFNGSWDQYVDSFTFSIPTGLDMFWKWNIRYPNSVPLTPFHRYIRYNQLDTNHYYNATPLAASNDVKAGKKVKTALLKFDGEVANATADRFQTQYFALLRELQGDLSEMRPTPIVSLATHEVHLREAAHKKETEKRNARLQASPPPAVGAAPSPNQA